MQFKCGTGGTFQLKDLHMQPAQLRGATTYMQGTGRVKIGLGNHSTWKLSGS